MTTNSVQQYQPFNLGTIRSRRPEYVPEGEVNIPQYEDIVGQVLGITPEMAQYYLTKNHCNRPLNANLVGMYTRAMTQGRWQHANGEPIIFGADDSLLDGQHRLQAIIRSKQTVALVVVTGVDPGKRASIDTGRKRSLGNYFAMLGEKETTTLAAALAWLYSYHLGLIESRGPNVSFVSHEDALEFLECHDGVRAAVRPGRSMQPFYSPGLGTFLYYLFAEIDQEQADLFAMAIAKGITSEESQPFYFLRERLIRERTETKGSRKRVGWVDCAVYGIRAWNAHRQGKKIHVLRWSREEPNVEPFPHPL